MTARDQARQWLADAIRTMPGADEMWDNAPNDIADAILDAPGVTVAYAWVTKENPRATHTQTFIWLPAVPLDVTADRPQSHADGTAGTGEGDGKGDTPPDGSQGDTDGHPRDCTDPDCPECVEESAQW